MVKFINEEKKLSEQQISELENFIKMKFPQEYRVHIINHNGGQCTPNIFTFTENGRETESCIDWFLAIYDGEYDNLKTYVEIFKIDEERLPKNLLPIAHDPGGNLICIACNGNNMGEVYFWDHEKETDNLHFIAKSFNAFLANLK